MALDADTMTALRDAVRYVRERLTIKWVPNGPGPRVDAKRPNHAA
jgi:hypothetical protein